LVEAVVEAPNGAWPLSCAGAYDYDHDFLAAYVEAARGDDATYRRFINEQILAELALV